MWLSRSQISWLACLALAFSASTSWADPPPDPLRLIPAQADIVAKIEDPRQLVEGVYNLEAVKEFLKFDAIKEAINSTKAKRFNQLVEFFEKKLGASKYELLDKLAGGGVALGVSLNKQIEEKPKAVLVIQGKDEKTTQEFVKVSLQVIEQELARQEKKVKIVTKDYQGITEAGIGPEFMLAYFGSTIVISNHNEAMKASLDLHLTKKGKSILANKKLDQGRKMLPKKLLAWAWLNMDPIHKLPEAKNFFETPSKDTNINLTFAGGMIDVARRSSFICAGLSQEKNKYSFTIQFPAGLKNMPPKVASWFPRTKGTTLPLLEPPNVLASMSYYLDLAEFWKNREKILGPQELKNLEDAEKQAAPFIGGVKLSDLFLKSGSHQRVVVTMPTKSVYKTKPKVPIQSFALIHEMRDPELANKLDRVIRLGLIAYAAAGPAPLKLSEIKHNGVDIVSYRFPEDKKLPGDNQDIRFNFSPSYAWVGNQFIASSTLELCENLVDVLQKEKNPKLVPAMFQVKGYSSGAAVALKAVEDVIITQAVLDQAISLDSAKQQVQSLIEMVEGLGTATVETQYTQNNLKINFVVKLGK